MKGIKKGSAQAASYAEREQRRKELQMVKVIMITQQQMIDAVVLTLNEEFGFGEERLKRFQEAFDKKYTEIRELEKDDTEDGEYSRYKTEKALQAACGKYYTPYEERYDFKILYNGKEVKL